jgi:hypothetical protein
MTDEEYKEAIKKAELESDKQMLEIKKSLLVSMESGEYLKDTQEQCLKYKRELREFYESQGEDSDDDTTDYTYNLYGLIYKAENLLMGWKKDKEYQMDVIKRQIKTLENKIAKQEV